MLAGQLLQAHPPAVAENLAQLVAFFSQSRFSRRKASTVVPQCINELANTVAEWHTLHTYTRKSGERREQTASQVGGAQQWRAGCTEKALAGSALCYARAAKPGPFQALPDINSSSDLAACTMAVAAAGAAPVARLDGGSDVFQYLQVGVVVPCQELPL
jgi:hypothetical protein